MASKFFLKPVVTILVTHIITGLILHCMFHICSISVHKLLCISFFSSSLCMTFLSAGIATSISMHMFSFLFLIIISGLCAVISLSVCTAGLHSTVTSSSSCTGLGMYVYHLSFQCVGLCILSSANVYQLYHVSLSVHFSPKWSILRLGGQ
jgi:hypothetical protein